MASLSRLQPVLALHRPFPVSQYWPFSITNKGRTSCAEQKILELLSETFKIGITKWSLGMLCDERIGAGPYSL